MTTVGKRVLARATVPAARAAVGRHSYQVRFIMSIYLSLGGNVQSPWHPLQCWSYDCRPGTCSGIVEVVVGMRLVSQNSMKRSKVSRMEYGPSTLYLRKDKTMKIAKSLIMDLAQQYSSNAKVGMMHRFYSGCLLYLVNLHAFTLLRRFSVTGIFVDISKLLILN